MHLVKWITEYNRPSNIINDQELHELLTAGRPKVELPTRIAISQDIKACFNKCRDSITKLLCVCSRLYFFFTLELTPHHL